MALDGAANIVLSVPDIAKPEALRDATWCTAAD